jgi:hypothetical protein
MCLSNTRTCPICRQEMFKPINLVFTFKECNFHQNNLSPEEEDLKKIKDENKNLKNAVDELKEKYKELSNELNINICKLQDIMV